MMVNKSIAKRSINGSEANSKISIMKRPSNGVDNNSKETKTSAPIKTLEQRQAEYNEARIRILGTADLGEDEDISKNVSESKTETEGIAEVPDKDAAANAKPTVTETNKKKKSKAKKKGKDKEAGTNKIKSPSPPDSEQTKVSTAQNTRNSPSNGMKPIKTQQSNQSSNTNSSNEIATSTNSPSHSSQQALGNSDSYGPQQLSKQFQNIRFQAPHQKLWTPDQPLKAFRHFQPNFPNPQQVRSSGQIRNSSQNFIQSHHQQQYNSVQQIFDDRMSGQARNEAEASPSSDHIRQAMMNRRSTSQNIRSPVPTAFNIRPQRQQLSDSSSAFSPHSAGQIVQHPLSSCPSLSMPFSYYQNNPPPSLTSPRGSQANIHSETDHCGNMRSMHHQSTSREQHQSSQKAMFSPQQNNDAHQYFIPTVEANQHYAHQYYQETSSVTPWSLSYR